MRGLRAATAARVRARAAVPLVVVSLLAAGGCGGGSMSFTGVWAPDDGSGLKIINSDGSCSGMYYNQGEPLDIGGSMTCTFSDGQSDGAYTVVVRQPPNETSYDVEVVDEDTMTLDLGGGSTVTLTRE